MRILTPATIAIVGTGAYLAMQPTADRGLVLYRSSGSSEKTRGPAVSGF
jgi:hypothetical protein